MKKIYIMLQFNRIQKMIISLMIILIINKIINSNHTKKATDRTYQQRLMFQASYNHNWVNHKKV